METEAVTWLEKLSFDSYSARLTVGPARPDHGWSRQALAPTRSFSQSAVAVEYTDYSSAECPGYDTKQSKGKAPVMLELWGMFSTPSLRSLPRPLWPRVIAADRAIFMGKIEINSALVLKWIAWNWTISTYKPRTHAKLNCLK